MAVAGLDPEKYILQQPSHVLIDEVKIQAELMSFDKPKLVNDLLQGAEIKYSPLDVTKYERVVDATGVSREFLPVIAEDILLPCIQCRVQTDEQLENRIKLGSIGYAWCFPLSDSVYHIGCGSLIADPRKIMEKLGWLSNNPYQPGRDILCECAGNIRLTGPQYSQPFATDGAADGVWGVGEAIGCVAPLAGDGVVPGMRSVRILMDRWDDPEGYTEAILKEFSWMKAERKVIDKLMKTEHLGVSDALVLRRNSRRMGMRVGLREAGMLIKNLR